MRAISNLTFVLALITAACSHSPMAPTTTVAPKAAPIPISFDINIPDIIVVQQMKTTYPQGIATDPIDAQRRWDYTAEYGGTPNVYAGPITLSGSPYAFAGVVIAPYAAAANPNPDSSQWSVLEPGHVYQWIGNFVYACVAAPGSRTTCSQ